MRITNSMMTSQYLSDLNGNMNRMSGYLKQETTGKRVNKISDDPVLAVQSLVARGKLSQVAQYKNSVSSAKSRLTEAESAVSELNEITKNAYDKALYAATGTMSDDDRAAVAQEIAQMRDEALTVGNAMMGDTYLFAGYNTSVSQGAPFQVDGNGDLLYNGLNISSEAAGGHIADSLKAVEDALGDATASNTAAAGADISQYATISNKVQSAADSISTLVDAAGEAIDGANDLETSVGLDSHFADDLDTLKKTALSKANAASAAATKLTDAAKAVDKAYSAWQDTLSAVPYDAAAASDAETAYNDAVTAAQTAAADTRTASQDAVAAAGDVKTSLTSLQATASGAVASTVAGLNTASAQVVSLQVGMGTDQTMQTGFSGAELLGRGKDNLYVILDELYQTLTSGDEGAGVSDFVSRLQNKQSGLLTLDTKLGAMQNRITSISDRYTQSTLSYKQMQSDAEDVDMAQAIENFSTAQTVYNAALASGAKILQTSLLDFIS